MAFRIGVLTVSDRRALGAGADVSGARVAHRAADLGEVVCREVVPDERDQIAARLRHMADGMGLDLVLTTRGTGLGPRDVTPEATFAVAERPPRGAWGWGCGRCPGGPGGCGGWAPGGRRARPGRAGGQGSGAAPSASTRPGGPTAQWRAWRPASTCCPPRWASCGASPAAI